MFAEILVLQKRRNLVNVTSVMCGPSNSAVDIEIHREIHQYPARFQRRIAGLWVMVVRDNAARFSRCNIPKL
jgi:hypothetical protein